ncbi:MAG: hypothetical protein EBU93_01765 [Chlamydiae bacterium]|nr:hypothetical protein [Chlamydiota bacterium]
MLLDGYSGSQLDHRQLPASLFLNSPKLTTMDSEVTLMIIGICGSGKTILTQALSEALHNSSMVFWDDFELVSEYPPDYVEWYKNGKDYSAWKTPVLAKALDNLKSRSSSVCPTTGKVIEPTKWIIYDAPLGRNHVETGQFIDFLVFLDTPAEVALARRLQRDYLSKDSLDKQAIQQELDTYIHFARPLFLDTDSLKNSANLVLDGMLPIHELVKKIINAIDQHHSDNKASI